MMIRIWTKLPGKKDWDCEMLNLAQFGAKEFENLAITEIARDEKYIDIYLRPFVGCLKVVSDEPARKN